MDIKQLKYLIALDQTRHFGQAAAACHITQPTLSMRIRNLEEELNLTLIQRGQRFEGFTPEGERILAWARAVLAAHDGLAAEAAICRGQMVGQLRVGMVPLASLNPMQLIKPLAEKYPALQFSLLSMTSEQIIDGVSRNQLDLGICYLQHLDEGQFKIARLPQTRMGLLHDKRHFDNKDNIAKMKDGVIIINNSRGGLIVEEDLADALNSGKVYAAAVDVVSTEPIKGDNPLLKAKNCLITPHISWAPKEARQRIMDMTEENIKAFIEGAPINVVNNV